MAGLFSTLHSSAMFEPYGLMSGATDTLIHLKAYQSTLDNGFFLLLTSWETNQTDTLLKHLYGIGLRKNNLGWPLVQLYTGHWNMKLEKELWLQYTKTTCNTSETPVLKAIMEEAGLKWRHVLLFECVTDNSEAKFYSSYFWNPVTLRWHLLHGVMDVNCNYVTACICLINWFKHNAQGVRDYNLLWWQRERFQVVLSWNSAHKQTPLTRGTV